MTGHDRRGRDPADLVLGPPAAVAAVLAALAADPCPDCHADARLERRDGTLILHVSHDDTCPAYRAMTGAGTGKQDGPPRRRTPPTARPQQLIQPPRRRSTP